MVCSSLLRKESKLPNMLSCFCVRDGKDKTKTKPTCLAPSAPSLPAPPLKILNIIF